MAVARAARVAMAAAACFACSSWFLVDFRFAQLDAYSMFWSGGYIYSRDLRHVFQNCWRPRGMGYFESYQHALEIQNHEFKDPLHIFSSCWYLPGSFSYCLAFMHGPCFVLLFCSTSTNYIWNRKPVSSDRYNLLWKAALSRLCSRS